MDSINLIIINLFDTTEKQLVDALTHIKEDIHINFIDIKANDLNSPDILMNVFSDCDNLINPTHIILNIDVQQLIEPDQLSCCPSLFYKPGYQPNETNWYYIETITHNLETIIIKYCQFIHAERSISIAFNNYECVSKQAKLVFDNKLNNFLPTDIITLEKIGDEYSLQTIKDINRMFANIEALFNI